MDRARRRRKANDQQEETAPTSSSAQQPQNQVVPIRDQAANRQHSQQVSQSSTSVQGSQRVKAAAAPAGAAHHHHDAQHVRKAKHSSKTAVHHPHRIRKRVACGWAMLGAGLALLGVLTYHFAQEGHLSILPYKVALPGGSAVTLFMPVVDVAGCISSLHADTTATMQRLAPLIPSAPDLSPSSLNISLSEMIPSLSLFSLESMNLTMRDLLAQLPGMGGTSTTSTSGEVSESTSRPGRQLAAKGYHAKHPVVIIPGFVTSGLEMWEGHPCARRYFRQRLWGTMTMMQVFLRDSSCWFEHLALDPVTGLDPPGIRVRAATGLESVDFFIQGYWVWGKLVEALADVGYDSNNLVSAAYDWRLAMPLMEARDGWFTRTRNTIELLFMFNKEKVVLTSHSYGENVARAFLHWAEEQQPGWVEKHIEAHVAIAGTCLGIPKAVTALLSGEMRDTAQLGPLAAYLTASLVPRDSRTRLFRSWASMLAMLPVGGPKIWGNATWAPDDTPAMRAAGRSYGSLITAARLVKVPSSASSGQQGDGFTANETETQSGDLPEVELGITSQSEQAAVQTARTPSAAHSQEQGGGGAADSSSSGDSSSLSSLSNAMSAATITAALRRLLGVGDDEEVRMSDLVHLDVSAAIRTALAASGPLAARKYRKWGAVHARAIQKQKGSEMNTTWLGTNSWRDTGGGINLTKMLDSDDIPIPMFPNALTTPLPHAPSMSLYTLYGVGVPTERAYHYIHPEGWKPDREQPTEQQGTCDPSRGGGCSGNKGSAAGAGAEGVGEGSKPGGNDEVREEVGHIQEDVRRSGGSGDERGPGSSQQAGPTSSGHGGSGSESSRGHTARECGAGDAVSGSSDDEDVLGHFDFKINTGLSDLESGLDSGIQMDEGDLTVPLISLGLMGNAGWRSKRLNPSGMRVVAKEYKHVAVSMLSDPRGGPETGSHVDILGNEALLSDILRIACGRGHEVTDRVYSRIHDIAANVNFEEEDGWE